MLIVKQLQVTIFDTKIIRCLFKQSSPLIRTLRGA